MNAHSHSGGSRVVVAGLGKTGISCVRYLMRQGVAVCATDSRSAPPALAQASDLAAKIDIRLGGFDLSLLEGASQLLMSPGISLREPIVERARARGIEVLGDIELFARAVRAPVIAVTGTNGKSTVTTMVAQMACADGRQALAGGNLGDPALDLLQQAVPDLYVLELSSFQLETTSSLRVIGATVLNLSADHMDRYASIDEYALAKARIFAYATTAVLNIDDAWVAAMRDQGKHTVTFSIAREDADFCLQRRGGALFIAVRGEAVLDVKEMKISGLHNAANALAALALGEAAGLSFASMLATLRQFPGLAHRSQWVADVEGVRYIDDSKGTNVGATLAAVAGLAGPLVVIAGGEGKGQDFKPLAAAFKNKVHDAILIGRDAPVLAAVLSPVCKVHLAASMQDAVTLAARAAGVGATVLLSPACASLDMFRDYAHRGAEFARCVQMLQSLPVRP